ncbi:BamA/TamA family outer membrane protein [Taibaiella koreensis]|uniref:hypothetical protein n=1 Tax=Taibaiella koreensis TaxID=1268548 RepID=UPI000E59BEC5|nr:hypothetical protein [Taibaiella koreensis]
MRIGFRHIVLLLFVCTGVHNSQAQSGEPAPRKRTFIGSIIYGIRTSFGKDTTGRRESITILNTDALLPYEGRIIRSIRTEQLGFEKNISDSAGNFIYFGTRALNAVHATSRDRTIRRNVYLQTGTAFNPYLAADNERYLRTIGFIQDSRIAIDSSTSTADSVDIIVTTKDLFAYSPSTGGLSPLRQRVGLTNINLLGTGQKLSFSYLHDSRRDPGSGIDAGYGYNNIAGSFINANFNFSKIARNIYDSREDEENFMLQLDRPLVSQYKRLAGGLSVGKGRSMNLYPNYYGGDYYRYDYGVGDVWVGYNLGARKYLNDQKLHVKKFIGIRYFNYNFFETPYQVNDKVFDQRFNSRQGILASLTLFRQYYYKTRYIYGFGITEDIPAGFNVSITAGWYKQLDLSRPYLGVDAYRYIVTRKRDIAGFFVRSGMFLNQGSIEDASLMFGGSFFTRVLFAGNKRIRQYFRGSYSAIVNRVALNPLRINNTLGVRNFNSDLASGNSRFALRSETFIFLQEKYFGFRLAPFASGDFVYLGNNQSTTDASGIFYGLGGGMRARNENLVFGTFELRGIIIPRKGTGDNRFKISVAVNLQFRYNSSYVSKPDIAELNGDVTGDIY